MSSDSRPTFVTVVSNHSQKVYFFAEFHHRYGLGEQWTVSTYHLPCRVGGPSGTSVELTDRESVSRWIARSGLREIPHPRPDLDALPNLDALVRALGEFPTARPVPGQ